MDAKKLACPCCGESKMSAEFVAIVDVLGGLFGKPLNISSGYRCPSHNAAVGGETNSVHCVGHAVDIMVCGMDSYRLIRIASRMAFTGMGVSQRGDHNKRFIHLDDAADSPELKRPRPWVWSY